MLRAVRQLQGGMHIRQISSLRNLIKARTSTTQNLPVERYYTQSHHWVDVLNSSTDSNLVKFGITNYGQDLYGDAIYVGVEQIDVEREITKNSNLCSIDTTLAGVVDMKVPITGTVKKINNELHEMAQLLSRDPEDEGWICQLEVDNLDEIKSLMSKEEYVKFTQRDSRKRESREYQSSQPI